MKKNLTLVCMTLILISVILPTSISTSKEQNIKINAEKNGFYGFIIDVNSKQSYNTQINISILVNQLLEENSSVYWTCSNNRILSSNLTADTNKLTKVFDKGSFIIPFSSNNLKNAKITNIIYQNFITKDIDIFKINQPLTDIAIYSLNNPKIVYFLPSAGDFLSYYKVLKKGGFKNHFLMNGEDILNGKLTDDYNIIIHGGGWAGGYATLLMAEDHFSPSTTIINSKIKEFISNGAGYIGSCGGLFLAGSGVRRPEGFPFDFASLGWKLTPGYSQLGIIDMPIYRALPGATGDMLIPNTGVDIRIVDQDCPVGFGLPEIIENTEYMCGPMFVDKKIGNTDAKVLGVIENVERKDLYLTDWTMSLIPWWNNKILPDSFEFKQIDRWINSSIGGAMWATSEYGNGRAVAFGGHPEQTRGNDPPRIVYNSVFYGASEGPMNISLDNEKFFTEKESIIDSPSKANISENINFDAIITDNSNIDCFVWSFGDETESFEKNTTHRYDEYGEYDIFLTAANNSHIIINTSSIDILGQLEVKTQNYYTHKDNSTVFSAFVKGGFEPYTWLWDFGDGDTSNEVNPAHRYEEIGVYKASIKVLDKYGNNASYQFSVVVNDEDNNFNVDFSTSILKRTNPNDEIIFTAKIMDIESSLKYNISFGDEHYFETSLTDLNNISVNHSYAKPGIYHASLILSNSSCKIYADCEMVYINNPPKKPKIEINREIQAGGPEIYIDESYLFNLTSIDPDGDQVWFIINFGKATYNYTIFTVDSGETLLVRDIRMVEGEYNIKVKAVDSYGAVSKEAVLNVTIEKGNLRNGPTVWFLRFLLKHPNSFPIFRMIFGTEMFEY